MDQTERLSRADGHTIPRGYVRDAQHPELSELARQSLAIILAGGRGQRLGPLTTWRAKPALPFGGKLRIIDFALSNCINSGVRRIGVCTQYKAQSLIRHVQQGWSFLDPRFGEFVELLPAQQRVTAAWYQGTADAVYQNLDLLRQNAPTYMIILAGDHVYKMDYAKMLADHVAADADMTVACMELPLAAGAGFGVMQLDDARRVIGFQEKPPAPAAMPGRPDTALVSMGIYVFNTPFLYEQLMRDADERDSSHDFGKDIIPYLIRRGYRVCAHRFADSCVNMTEGRPYWRDVGTIDAYWEANMELVKVTPDLNLYDRAWPVWTYPEQLPPAKFVFDDDARRGHAMDSLVSGGCIVSGSSVRRSVLFSRARVHSYCTLDEAVIMPDVEIGRHCVLKRVVVDKYCKLREGLQAGVDLEADRRRFHVTDGGVTLITPEMIGQRIHHLR